MANLGNVAGGHKATMANPKVSETAKEHSRQVLDEMESRGELPEQQRRGADDKNLGNVVGGHKATLKNPNASEGAKEHSKQVLEDMDA